MSRIRPMYGRGNGKRIESPNQTEDMFGGVTDKDERAHFALRCECIISFLEGKRSDPALSNVERTHGVLLHGGESGPVLGDSVKEPSIRENGHGGVL